MAEVLISLLAEEKWLVQWLLQCFSSSERRAMSGGAIGGDKAGRESLAGRIWRETRFALSLQCKRKAPGWRNW